MKIRQVISLFSTFSFFILLITSSLLFLTAHSNTVSNLHTVFGFLFIVSSIIHIIYNFRIIISYIVNKKSTKKSIKKEFVVTLIFSTVMLFGTILFIPPFSTVLNIGKTIRKIPGIETKYYETIFLEDEKEGLDMIVELKSGKHYSYTVKGLFSYTVTPQFAVWMEDTKNNFIKTIFATNKGATGNFLATKNRRIEALPLWFHKRLDTDYNDNTIDSISGASPVSDFNLVTKTGIKERQFRVFIELNRSYDYNEYYPEGSELAGVSGQPALVFSVDIDLDNPQKFYIFQIAGHSHPLGLTGELFPDTSKIDSAFELMDRMLLEIKYPGESFKK